MDILIRGMEMPKGGYRTVEIGFDADGHPMALADDGDVFDVIPIPPHGDLIDRDALMDSDSDLWDGMWGWSGVKIANASTVIPEEEGE